MKDSKEDVKNFPILVFSPVVSLSSRLQEKILYEGHFDVYELFIIKKQLTLAFVKATEAIVAPPGKRVVSLIPLCPVQGSSSCAENLGQLFSY